MKKHLLAVACLVALGPTALAQSSVSSAVAEFGTRDAVPESVPLDSSFSPSVAEASLFTSPSFPGGIPALKAYFRNPGFYPQEARAANVEGTVQVRFLVQPTGELTHVKVMHPHGTPLDQAARAAVEAMPRWKPARMGDEPVASLQQLRVTFRLD